MKIKKIKIEDKIYKSDSTKEIYKMIISDYPQLESVLNNEDPLPLCIELLKLGCKIG